MKKRKAGNGGGSRRRMASQTQQRPEASRIGLELDAMVELFRVLGAEDNLHNSMRAVTVFLQRWSGCEAVGIRLREGDDYPYFESRGFPSEFIHVENLLCTRGLNGQIERDSAGNPILKGVCGSILLGRFDPSKPFFTEGGSFWSNCTLDLLKATNHADRQGLTGSLNNGEGYESVALVPLRADGTTFGLIQMNDKRTDRFTSDFIRQAEQLANSIALALAHRKSRQALSESETKFRQFFEQMRTGCAMHRIVCDEDGHPIDYITLDVNPEFEKLLGVNERDIVGKRALEAVPNLDHAWIENFGRVALTGEPWRYEQYASNVDKWFEGVAYSPNKGYFNVTFVDISETKRAQISALNSETHLKLAQGAAHLGTWEWDPATEKVMWSDEMFSIFQINKKDFCGDPSIVRDRIHPDDRELYRSAIETTSQPGLSNSGPLEFRIVLPDGTVRHLASDTRILRAEGNEPDRLLGTVQDVTARKKAEEQAREMEYRFTSFMENSPASAIIKNSAGEILYANHAFEIAFGLGKRGWLNRRDSEMWDSETTREMRHNDFETLSKRESRTFEEKMRHPDGKRHTWVKQKFPFRDLDGNILLGIIGTDVTAEKEMADALRRSQSQWQALFQYSLTGVILAKPDGNVLDANPEACRLLARTREEICHIGRAGILDDTDPRGGAALRERAETGQFKGELKFKRSDGSSFPVRMTSTIFMGPEGEPMASIFFEDITERKRAQEHTLLLSEVLASIGDAVTVTDTENRILFVNNAFERLYGYSSGELSGQSADVLWSESAALGISGHIVPARLTDGWFGELINRRKDGSEFPIELRTSAVRDREGNTLYLVGVARDITARKEAEQQLADALTYNQTIFDASPIGIITYKESGEVIVANRAAAMIVGTTLEGLRAQNFRELESWERSGLTENAVAALSSGVSKGVELNHVSSFGKPVWLSARFVPFLHDGKKELLTMFTDISERKRLELEYSTILQTAMDGFWLLDGAGKLLEVNEAYCRMIGYDRDELLMMGIGDLEVKESPDDIKRHIDQIRLLGESRFETRHRRKDGTIVDVEISTKYTEGEKEKLVVFVRDISQSKRIENALKYSEEKFRSLTEKSIFGIYIIQDAKMAYVNPSFARTFGYSPDEIIGTLSPNDLIHPDDIDAVLGKNLGDLEGRSERENFAYKGLRKDGSIISIQVYGMVVVFQGKPAVMGTLVDVTEQKRAEEALQESEIRFRTLIDHAPVAILVSRNGIGLYANQKCAQTFGLKSVEESVSRLVLEYFAPQSREESKERTRLRSLGLPVPSEFESVGVRMDGSQFPMQITVASVQLREGSANVAFVADISERKHVEELLRASERLASATINALSANVCVIDHEGTIVSVNEAWRAFANANGAKAEFVSEGTNYLQVCETANGDDSAGASSFASGIRAVMMGDMDTFTHEYPCHSPGEKRWFVGRVTRFSGRGPAFVVVAHENITERKLTDQRLEEERALLRTIIESIPDEIAVKDRERRFVVVNPATVHALNLQTAAQTLGKRDEDLIPAEFARQAREDELEVIRTGIPIINRLPKPKVDPVSGKIRRSILISKIPLRNVQGNIIGVVGINRDITEIQRTKMALENSEIKYRSFFENAAIPIWEEDFSEVKQVFDTLRSSGITEFRSYFVAHPDEVKRCAGLVKILATNDESIRLFQARSREELERSLPNYFVDASWGVFMEQLVALAEGRSKFTAEIPVQDLRGVLKDLIITLSVAPTSRQSLSRVLVSFVNITERKAMEQELRKLSRAVEQSPASILITDTAGTIEYVNPKFEEVTGYSSSEVIGQNPRILKSSHTPQSEYKELWETILSGKQWNGELQNVKKNGSLFWESVHISPILDTNGTITHLLGVKEEITQQKEFEEELIASRESLRLLAENLVKIREEERSSVAREVHDELGQILTAVKMDISALLQVGFSSPQAVSQKADSVFSLIDLGIKAVQQLSSRLRPGVLDDLGLVAAIEWQAEDFQQRTGIKCSLQLPDDVLNIDRDRATAMFRIFQESMTNVARHSKATSVSVTLQRLKDELHLHIIDDGIGISTSQIQSPKAFGLIGIRERLHPYQGKLELEGSPGGGTLLAVSLPMHNASGDTA